MKDIKKQKIIKATINDNFPQSCSFKNNETGYYEVLKICEKCRFFDDKTDFPNAFCDKNSEMIDFHFNTLVCPLGKFKIIDLNTTGEIVNEG